VKARGLALALLAPACVLAWAHWWHPAMLDDAFITFRYARNWATGEGLTFNAGAPPVEGYTNFLWLAIAAVGLKCGLDPVMLMPLVGVACALATLFVLGRATHGLVSDVSPVVKSLPALLVGVNPLFAMWAVSGMETPLVTLCVAGGVCSVAARRGQAHWTAALWFLAAVFTRPDAMLWALVMGLCCLRTDARRALVQFALPFALAFGAYWIWRWMTFDAFWPNTFHAKQGGSPALFLMGCSAVAWGLLRHLPFAMSLMCALILIDYARKHRPSVHAVRGTAVPWITGAVFVHLLYVVWSGGDAFAGDRLLMPALPAMALLLALCTHLSAESRLGRQDGISVAVLVLLAALLPLREAVKAADETRVAQWRWTCAGEWLGRHLPAGTRVALNPIGAIGYHAPDLFIIDMLGLTDAVIAREPVREAEQWLKPGHRKGSAARVLALAPDVILINNVWLHPGWMMGWTPLYRSESELFAMREELLQRFEMFNRPVPEEEWPETLPSDHVPEGVETLWIGGLKRQGMALR
jgi:arabinofuranosyltransferase